MLVVSPVADVLARFVRAPDAVEVPVPPLATAIFVAPEPQTPVVIVPSVVIVD